MTEQDTRRAALAQIDATRAAVCRLRELATQLQHGLEQAHETLAHHGEALWEGSPKGTADVAWGLCVRAARDAIEAADALKPAASGKPMPAITEEEAKA